MVVGCTGTFSFSWLGSVSQLIGCEKDPVQVPYLPLDSVFVSETKKFPETFLVSIVKYFVKCFKDQCGELSSNLLFLLYRYLFQILYSYASDF